MESRNHCQPSVFELLIIRRGLEARFFAESLSEWWHAFVDAFQIASQSLPEGPERDHAIELFAESLAWLGFAVPDGEDTLAAVLKRNVGALDFSLQRLSSNNTSRNPARTVATWIEDHYSEYVTLATLAGVASVSEKALRMAFLVRYQCSPQEYLNRVRLARAGALISQGVKREVAARLVGLSRISLYRKERKSSLIARRRNRRLPGQDHSQAAHKSEIDTRLCETATLFFLKRRAAKRKVGSGEGG